MTDTATPERAVLVWSGTDKAECAESLAELAQLAESAGLTVIGELSQEIRRVRPALGSKTLFISGILFGQSTVEQLGSIGAGFLSKPFQLRALIEAVDRISHGRASA